MYLTKIQEEVLPLLVEVNRQVVSAFLRKETKIDIVNAGNDYSEVQTNLDITVSEAMLNGVGQFMGLAKIHEGSFTEEKDSPKRHLAQLVYQVDPIDGTGDLKKTIGTDLVISATSLVSLLNRTPSGSFEPVASIIFDVVGEWGVVASGREISFFSVDEYGAILPVTCRRVERASQSNLALGLRTSYPQKNYNSLLDQLNSKKVVTGGAGIQALQFLRSYFEPEQGELPGFRDLEPLDVIFNCQPDWKTWDSDPLLVACRVIQAIGGPEYCADPTDIFGRPLIANASLPLMKPAMWHTFGCVFGSSKAQLQVIEAARGFMCETGLNLLEINY